MAPPANLTPAAMPTTTASVAAATPAAATPGATPVPASLLRQTQAANLLTGSPLAATPASRAQPDSAGRQPRGPPTEHRAAAAPGMHAPSQATQNTEVRMLLCLLCLLCTCSSGCNTGLLGCSLQLIASACLVPALPVASLCFVTSALRTCCSADST